MYFKDDLTWVCYMEDIRISNILHTVTFMAASEIQSEMQKIEVRRMETYKKSYLCCCGLLKFS